jgi:hypothetical protein
MEVTKQDASMQKYAAAKMGWKQKLRREIYWEKMVNKNRFSQVVHTNHFSGQFRFFSVFKPGCPCWISVYEFDFLTIPITVVQNPPCNPTWDIRLEQVWPYIHLLSGRALTTLWLLTIGWNRWTLGGHLLTNRWEKDMLWVKTLIRSSQQNRW